MDKVVHSWRLVCLQAQMEPGERRQGQLLLREWYLLLHSRLALLLTKKAEGRR
jgi:hypothetical protein